MSTPRLGQVLTVRYTDQFQYTLVIRVAEVAGDKFSGEIQAIFAAEGGELIGGDVLRLKGQTKSFNKNEIIE